MPHMAPLTLLTSPFALTVFHDPRDPSSEYALQALQLGCQRYDVRRTDHRGSRPTPAELRDIAQRLEGDPVDALVRRGKRYRSLGIDMDGASMNAVVDILSSHPDLLATPILDDGHSTMVGTSLERCDAWAVTGRVVDARPASLRRAA